MNYLQLKDWLGAFIEDIDGFRDELSDNYTIVDEYAGCSAILPPKAIKENLINDLQEILDIYKKNDV